MKNFQNSAKKYETDIEQINAKLRKKKSQIKKLEHKNYEKKRMLKRCHQSYEGKYKELTNKHKETITVLKKTLRIAKDEDRTGGQESERSQDLSKIYPSSENTFSKSTPVHAEDFLVSSEDDEELILKKVVTAQNTEIIGDLLDDVLSKIVNNKIETQEIIEGIIGEILDQQDDNELLTF